MWPHAGFIYHGGLVADMATASDEHGGGSTRSRLTGLIQKVNPKRILIVYTFFLAVYIYLPILSIIAFSFNSAGLTFPFVEVSVEWYYELLANESMIGAVRRSLQLAVVVMLIVTPMATATALAYRFDFWGRRGLLFLLILGIITPGITYGVASTLLLNEILGLSEGLWLAVPVHTVWTLPFAVIILLAGFPPNLAENENAARVMGAGTWTRFRKIILPQIAPTVLGAAVFAFTLSYNEGTRGILLVGRDNTMPIEIFATAASQRITPELFALGSITTVASTILLAIAGFLVIYRSRF
jgi:putative spermidine/putrescine transport system permease protein